MFLPSFLEEERGKKDGRGKNVNKENMGEGQKRENGVFTRKLWPVFVALCQLWIIVSKMIVAFMIIDGQNFQKVEYEENRFFAITSSKLVIN